MSLKDLQQQHERARELANAETDERCMRYAESLLSRLSVVKITNIICGMGTFNFTGQPVAVIYSDGSKGSIELADFKFHVTEGSYDYSLDCGDDPQLESAELSLMRSLCELLDWWVDVTGGMDVCLPSPPVSDSRGIYSNTYLAPLIKKADYYYLPFKALPVEAQHAMIHYMSVDGAAWAVQDGWLDWKWGEGKPSLPEMRAEALADIEKFRCRFVESYGDRMFGYGYVPTADLVAAVNRCEEETDGFARSIVGRSSGEYETATWPVILSSHDDEVLQDGWNRLAAYVHQKARLVPVLWYVDCIVVDLASD